MWSLIFLEILLVAINLIKIAAIVKPSKKCVPTYLTLSINVSTEKIVISTLLTGIYANRKNVGGTHLSVGISYEKFVNNVFALLKIIRQCLLC